MGLDLAKHALQVDGVVKPTEAIVRAASPRLRCHFPRPGNIATPQRTTLRTWRGAACQMAKAETTLHAIAMSQASA